MFHTYGLPSILLFKIWAWQSWWNTWNILLKQLKHLKTYSCNMRILSLQHMQHPRSTFARFRWNAWNISLKCLKYLKHDVTGDHGLPSGELWWGWGAASASAHSAAQGYELILSSSTCSRAAARLSACCADPLLRRFDTLFVVLVKQGSSYTDDPHRLHYFAEDGLEGSQDVAPGGCHGTRDRSSTRSLSWSSPRRHQSQWHYVRE
jgi:hypothetical protein